MTKLPAISGRECLKVLQKAGFTLKRQEGSHMILRRDDPFCQVVVPDHKSWIAERFGRSSGVSVSASKSLPG